MNNTEIKNHIGEPSCNDVRHSGISYNFDCKFIVGSDPDKAEAIYGCKYLFAVESPVFEKMLVGDFLEAKCLDDGIPLPDDNPRALRHFRFLTCCTDRVSFMNTLSHEDLFNLSMFCHKYDALSISNLCNKRLLVVCDTAPIEFFVEIYGAVRLLPEDDPLYLKCINKLRQNYFPLTEEIYRINFDDFKAYISENMKIQQTSVCDVFYCIERYLWLKNVIPKNLKGDTNNDELTNNDDGAQNDSEIEEDKRKLSILKDFLNRIDFAKMDESAFFHVVKYSTILTLEQKFYIITSICEKKPSIKLFEK